MIPDSQFQTPRYLKSGIENLESLPAAAAAAERL
jgi:hypothetical protein